MAIEGLIRNLRRARGRGENEVHVVYERSVKLDVDGSPMVKLSCEDCDVKFSLGKNIR